MIKCGDSTSDPDHGKDRSDSDAYQVMRKDKTNRDCQTDIKKVETIFGKSYAFVDEIGDCLNNSISGIWDDTHVQRHGGTDACQMSGDRKISFRAGCFKGIASSDRQRCFE